MQVWCGAGAGAWPQSREADDGGASAVAGQRRGGSGCSCWGWVLPGRVLLCREHISVVLLHIPALWSHYLLHALLCSSITLHTYFWPLLAPAEGGFAEQQAKGVGDKSRSSANLPLFPLLSWDRGRNGKKQQILPEVEIICPLYCYFAHSSLTFCKINWLSRIWVLFWASIFSASSAYSRMIGIFR